MKSSWKYVLAICIMSLMAFVVGLVSRDPTSVNAGEVVTVMPPAITVVVTVECCETCQQPTIVAPLLFVPTSTPVVEATNTHRVPDPKNTPTSPPTINNTPIPPSTEPPVRPTEPPATEPPSSTSCNQGRGNGSEGCDPGNSNHNQISNDEPGHRGKGKK